MTRHSLTNSFENVNTNNINRKSLNITYMNINGMQSKHLDKFNESEIIEMFEKNDIILFTETHFNNENAKEREGFYSFFKCRKKTPRAPS